MRANLTIQEKILMKNSLFAAGLIGFMLAMFAHTAEAQKVPSQPAMPSAPTAAPGVRPQPPTPSFTPQNPMPVATQPSIPLTYKEFSLPLSIGDMSSLQAKKLDDDFLKKLGYTSTPTPVEPLPQKDSPSQLKAALAAKPKPADFLLLTSIFGPLNRLSAELIFNGVPLSLKVGREINKSITVKAINPESIELLVTKNVEHSKKKSGKDASRNEPTQSIEILQIGKPLFVPRAI